MTTRLRGPGSWTLPEPGTRFNRVAYSAAHVVADPFSSADPWLAPAIDWDATLALPELPLVARPRRRRGDGHRAARHGPRLADLARADRSLAVARARDAGSADRQRRRHRSSRAAAQYDHRRRDRRLRAAMRSDRKPRRPHHPHGQPRARGLRQVPRRLRESLRAHPAAGDASR